MKSFFIFLIAFIGVESNPKFSEEVLEEQNYFRQIHDSNNLTLDASLILLANRRARKAAADGRFLVDKAGENSYRLCSPVDVHLSGKDVVDYWYKQCCNSGFSSEDPYHPSSESCTQLIWRDSKKFGVSYAFNDTEKRSCVYIAAAYRPPGNIRGFYKENFKDAKGNVKRFCKEHEENGKLHLSTRSHIANFAKKTLGGDLLNGKDGFLLGKQKIKIKNNKRTLVKKHRNPNEVISDMISNFVYSKLDSKQSPRIDLGRSQIAAESASDSRKGIAVPDVTTKSSETRTGTDVEVSVPENLETLKQEAVDAHNAFRSLHGVPSMVLDARVSKEAQEWADQLAARGTLELESKTDEGENSFLGCSNKGHRVPAWRAVAEWYKEVCEKPYHFNEERGHQGAGHFTQVIWSNSKHLGVGAAERRSANGRRCTYIVARYKEPGNVLGAFRNNVPMGKYNNTDCLKIYDLAKRSQRSLTEDGFDTTLYERQILSIHNALRSLHQSPVLHLNEKLSEEAEAWARHLSEGGKLQHDSTTKDGENLFLSCNPGNVIAPPDHVVSAWYRELCKRGYYFNQESGDQGVPRFTQLVWKNSSNLGVGIATKKRSSGLMCSYVVGRYSTPGNSNGMYKSNVEAGAFNLSVCNELPQITSRASIAAIDEYVVSIKKSLTEPPAVEALRIHNDFRALHNSPPLQIDIDATKEATRRANQLMRMKLTGKKYQSTDGENIYSECGHQRSLSAITRDAVMNWYDEGCSKRYNFDKENGPQGSKHFTQLLWKNSDRIGLAAKQFPVDDKTTCTYVVAKYHNPGNVIGQFRENIPRGSFSDVLCARVRSVAVKMENEDDSVAIRSMSTLERDDKAVHNDSYNGTNAIAVNNNLTNEETLDAFTREAIEAHNKLRAIHNAPPLQFNTDLSKEAYEYAKLLAKNGKEPSVRSSVSNEGENVAYACGMDDKDMSAVDAVKSWYSEVCKLKDFDFTKPQMNEHMGKFSQIISKDNNEIGMGRANIKKDNVKCTFIVARYKHTGGSNTGRKNNIERGKFNRTTMCQMNPIDAAFEDLPHKENKSKAQGDDKSEKMTVKVYDKFLNTKKNALLESLIDDRHTSKKENLGEGYSSMHIANTEIDIQIRRESSADRASGVANEALEVTNKFRKIHKSPKLELDPELFAKAQLRVDGISKESKENATEGGNSLQDVGENLYINCVSGEPKDINVTEAIILWYKEACLDNINPGNNNDYSDARHFAQIVWKDSKKFGAASSSFESANMTCSALVAFYEPTGNILGQYAENVERGDFKKKDCKDLEGLLRRTKLDAHEKQPENVDNTTDNASDGDPSNKQENNPTSENNEESKQGNNTDPDGGRNDGQNPQNQPNATNADGGDQNPQNLQSQPNATNPGESGQNPQSQPNTTNPGGNSQSPQSQPNATNSAGNEQNPQSQPNATNPDESGQNPQSQPNATNSGGNKQSPQSQPNSDNSDDNEQNLQNSQSQPNATNSNESGQNPQNQPNTTNPGGNTQSPQIDANNGGNNGTNPQNQPNNTSPGGGDGDKGQNPEDEGGAKAESTSPCAGSGGSGDTAEVGLAAHNKFRKIHNAPPMELDPQLTKGAEEYAKVIANLGSLKHSEKNERDGAGENLAYGCMPKKPGLTVSQATVNWYKEVCDPGYDFVSHSFNGGTLHFTQVVWKKSTKLGIGMASAQKDGMDCVYVVGRYKVHGNMDGEYKDNVEKGSFTKESCDRFPQILKEIEGEACGKGNASGTEADTDSKKDANATSKNEKDNQLSGGVIVQNSHGTHSLFTNHSNKQSEKQKKFEGGKEKAKYLSKDDVNKTALSKLNNSMKIQKWNASKHAHQDHGKDDNSNSSIKVSPIKTNNGFPELALKAHNRFRAIHDSPKMELDKELIKEAEKRASSFAKSGKISPPKQGENILNECSSTNATLRATDAVKTWYREVCDPGYDFEKPESNGVSTDHFSQMIWKESNKLGIALATSFKDNMYCSWVVAKYKKNGNEKKGYGKNVKKGSFDSKVCKNVDLIVAELVAETNLN